MNAEASRGRRLREVSSSPEFLIGAFLVVLCLFMAIWEPLFSSKINLQNLGKQSSILIIVSVGLLFVMLVGGIDLSISGVIAFTTILAAKLSVGGLSPGWAFVIAIAAAGCIGLINGLMIGVLRLSPIIITLASGQLLIGISYLLTTSGPIQATDPNYGKLASSLVGPIPMLAILAAASVFVVYLLLKRFSFGRYVYAVGGNETAAWLAGVPVSVVKVSAYVLTGLFSGVAGVLLSSRVTSGEVNLGSTVMFSAFAAIFIGGVGFGNGRGNVSGVAIVALVLGVISNAIDLKGIQTEYQYVISAVLIVTAIVIQAIPSRFGRRAEQ